MKKSRFTEEQMVTMLREADKESVAEVSKKYGVSDQTIYNWRQHFGGMDATDVKRLKQLEQENARLKKIQAATTGLTLWFMTHLLRSCMCQPELSRSEEIRQVSLPYGRDAITAELVIRNAQSIRCRNQLSALIELITLSQSMKR
jgi:putative transposase